MLKQRFTSRMLARTSLLTLLVAGLGACGGTSTQQAAQQEADALAAADDTSAAIFAAGCFWCVEEAFDAVDGVVTTTSGYIGGSEVDPSYKAVSRGKTGHTEALRVQYDPQVVTYGELLDVFWRNVDPTDAGGQFCDRGRHYRSGVFTLGDAQHRQAVASRKALMDDPDAPSPIVTEVTRAGPFYAAEDYHQNYHRTNPYRYKYYKSACGRAARLEELWG